MGFNVFFAVVFVVVLAFKRNSTIEGRICRWRWRRCRALSGCDRVRGFMVAAVHPDDRTRRRNVGSEPSNSAGMVDPWCSRTVAVALATLVSLLIISSRVCSGPELASAGPEPGSRCARRRHARPPCHTPLGRRHRLADEEPNGLFGFVCCRSSHRAASRESLSDQRAARTCEVARQVFPIYWLGLGVRSAFLTDFGRFGRDRGLVADPADDRRTRAWAVAGLLVARPFSGDGEARVRIGGPPRDATSNASMRSRCVQQKRRSPVDAAPETGRIPQTPGRGR